jgi:preprotein translocase subunit SecE
VELSIYKRSQAKKTRIWTAAGAAVVVGFGCWQLYAKLQGMSTGLSRNTQFVMAVMIPTVVFVSFGLLALWMVNRPSVADFMISAEGELKKVSWSSRAEIVASTIIVLFVIAAMAALLGFTDLIFAWFFNLILLG